MCLQCLKDLAPESVASRKIRKPRVLPAAYPTLSFRSGPLPRAMPPPPPPEIAPASVCFLAKVRGNAIISVGVGKQSQKGAKRSRRGQLRSRLHAEVPIPS